MRGRERKEGVTSLGPKQFHVSWISFQFFFPFIFIFINNVIASVKTVNPHLVLYSYMCVSIFILLSFPLVRFIFNVVSKFVSRNHAGGRLRHAFIGIGFRERAEAYDF